MNHRQCLPWSLLILAYAVGSAAPAAENLALGKKYTLSPAPNYVDCIDPGDATQLTDGKITEKHFWTQPETVGWTHVAHVAITVDLGRVEPIGDVSYHMAAGVANVQWPLLLEVLVSDDGNTFRDCGDLVSQYMKDHGPWPEGYAIRRLTMSGLRARGRFVRFIVVSSPYIFCDEVEVFRGPDELLQGEPTGIPVTDMQSLVDRGRLRPCLERRYEADIAAVKATINATTDLAPDVRRRLEDDWTKAAAALRASEQPDKGTFRAVLPYCEAHAALFQVQAALWKAQGRADLSYGVPATWDPTDLTTPPQDGGQIEVHTMRGEYRAAAVNLANASAAPIDVRVAFEGLPGSSTPDYVAVQDVPWTDTFEGKPVLAALPVAQRDGSAWRLTVLPGLVRQVWLTFHAEQVPPGDYAGSMIVETSGQAPLRVPVRLHVYPIDLPGKTTLLLGGWDDSDGKGSYGITAENKKAFLGHLREHFVNAPWGTARVMLSHTFSPDGSVVLDTQRMDAWLADWPDARRYYVFLAVGGANSSGEQSQFDGTTPGTPEFDRKVQAWISAWVRHLGTKGIQPEQLGLLVGDEPRENGDYRAYLAWIKAIHAAEPKVVVWIDPIFKDPSKAPIELFDACDVLCPNRPMWLANPQVFGEFYLDQQRKGRALDFYSCSGPARLLDPYSYYRLQAWHCNQIGATGEFFWAFGDNSGSSSWNEYFATFSPYTPLFVDPAGVTAAKQMEAIREGVEDFETIRLFREAVHRAKAAGRSDAMLADAELLLSTAMDEVLGAPNASEIRWHSNKDRTKADAVRIRMLETLSALGQQ